MTSYTDEQVLEILSPSRGGFVSFGSVKGIIESLLADRTRLQAEVEALRACALKYLAWHHVEDPAEGLERDLCDPDMCGYAAAKYSARVKKGDV